MVSIKEFSMNKSKAIWYWVSAILSILMGVFILMKDSSAGWFLIIMGIVYIGLSTRAGQGLTSTNPKLAKWALIGITLLLLALTLIVILVVS
jgi:hypothetical protein